MGVRKNIYFSDVTSKYLEKKDNFSEYIQTLILRDMNDKSLCLKRREELLTEQKKLQIRLKEVEDELFSVDQEIERIDHMFNDRPDEYYDVVITLKHLKNGVSQEDLQNQAKALGIETGLLKRWLFDDGVYDELLLR